MIKTLVVEDSGLMRIMVADILRSDDEIEVVDTATNGRIGLEKIRAHKPDVVVTDMVMPEYDGLYLVKNVMRRNPLPIIILSSLERTDSAVFDAIELGAVDFIDKPRNGKGFKVNGHYPLVDIVKHAAKLKPEILEQSGIKRNDLSHTFLRELRYSIVAIGASTGGPGAIEALLQGLPSNFPVPIVIAQHMPERFLISFALRLDKCTPLNVKIARKGETLQPNHVYIAPGDGNIEVVKNPINGNILFGFNKRKFNEFNNPSVDCLFESVARVFEEKAMCIILTGMGKDGTQGLLDVKKFNGLSIAQDEKSSIVFGMPKAAIDAKLVDHVVSIRELPGFITICLS